ncbi:MAG: hypothetical protein SH819_14735 [Cytophagales bacterium]|nr:hypothetical protein [Cytophagales bacterium]
MAQKRRKPDTRTVDDIIFELPRPEQAMMKKLRDLIQDCIPKATEQIRGLLFEAGMLDESFKKKK